MGGKNGNLERSKGDFTRPWILVSLYYDFHFEGTMKFEQVRIQINLYHKYLAIYELKFLALSVKMLLLS